MSKSIHLGGAAAGLTRYKTIHYRLAGSIPDIIMQDVYWAVSQAFSIWSAYTPLRFVRRNTVVEGDVHITFRPDGPGGALGNAIIEIDTAEKFFIDKFRTPDTASWGPFDLIAAIAHEIGHNVFGSLIPDPHEDNDIGGSMMRSSFGEGQVLRQLKLPADIEYCQKKHGRVPAVTLIQYRLDNASQINYAPQVDFSPTTDNIFINGAPGTSSVFQVYSTEVKGKRINAINIEVRVASGYAIINRVDVWDLFAPQEMQVLSLTSNSGESTDFSIKVGMSHKPIVEYGLLVRIEVLFLEKFENRPVNAGWDRALIVSSINAEVLPAGMPEEFVVVREVNR